MWNTFSHCYCNHFPVCVTRHFFLIRCYLCFCFAAYFYTFWQYFFVAVKIRKSYAEAAKAETMKTNEMTIKDVTKRKQINVNVIALTSRTNKNNQRIRHTISTSAKEHALLFIQFEFICCAHFSPTYGTKARSDVNAKQLIAWKLFIHLIKVHRIHLNASH